METFRLQERRNCTRINGFVDGKKQYSSEGTYFQFEYGREQTITASSGVALESFAFGNSYATGDF